MESESTTVKTTEFIFKRLTDTVSIGGVEYRGLIWLAILIPVLIAALVYVVWMYVRDARGVGWAWATFLGGLRILVYLILALMFLLPAFQTVEKTELHSKVLMLFDVSASMNTTDGLPDEAASAEKLLSRQDKVIQFLMDEKADFLPRLEKKNPVTAYRFANSLDEEAKVFEGKSKFTKDDWNAWLIPETLPEVPKELVESLNNLNQKVEEARKAVEAQSTEQTRKELLDAQAKAMTERLKVDEARRKVNLYNQIQGTNLGEPLLAVLNRESKNWPRGIILYSDGRATQHSKETLEKVRDRAAKARIPVFVVAVGADRIPVNIRIADLVVPDQTRPDDKFPVTVELEGAGKLDEDVDVVLDVTRPNGEGVSLQLKETARFKRGEPPHAQVKFEIDPARVPQELLKKDSSTPELLDGDWKFQVRVPKDKREIFLPKEHVSEVKTVAVKKKPIRVLLFADGPTREYQFIRTLMARECNQLREGAREPLRKILEEELPKISAKHPKFEKVLGAHLVLIRATLAGSGVAESLDDLMEDEHLKEFWELDDPEVKALRAEIKKLYIQGRVKLCICLQHHGKEDKGRPEILQDVPPDRMLKDFPRNLTRFDDPELKERYGNLMQYDVIIAFDPDWTRLDPEQFVLLERWVSRHHGGFIFVAGPVNTFRLTRKDHKEKVRPLLDLLPVWLEDKWGLAAERTTTDPWRLIFPGATTEMEFLKLDDESKEPLSGWEEFFTGRKPGEVSKELPPRRGFFDVYPVSAQQGVKPSATVVACFTDPRAPAMPDGKPHPYLVTMPYGGGKVVYFGSGETWRLRQFREAFHERFWTKLCRYLEAGASGGVIVMKDVFTANERIVLEARLYGRDLKPLSPSTRVKVTVRPIKEEGADQKKKEDPKKKEAGPPEQTADLKPKMSMQEYERLSPEERERQWEGWFEGGFELKAPGKYEVLLPVPGSADKPLTSKFEVKRFNPELLNTRPDFVRLGELASAAGEVQGRVNNETWKKLVAELKRTSVVLGRSVKEDKDLPLFFDLKAAAQIPDCMDAQKPTQESKGKVEDLWDDGFVLNANTDPPRKLSYALFLVVALLSVEWLTRKLLKLA